MKQSPEPSQSGPVFPLTRPDWLLTPLKEPRGYIQPGQLKELWFHTGTICNLSCSFCLEGSKPGDNRLNRMTLDDVRPFINEALVMGVEKFSFTGGEPFVIKDMVKILDYALDRRPCLVLTNATHPLRTRLDEVKLLLRKPHSLNFRVSLDYPHPARHDEGRGQGNFYLSMETLSRLYQAGFGVSIARQRQKDENVERQDRAYRPYLKKYQLPKDIRIVSFPDFHPPGTIADVPYITEDCMTRSHTEKSRQAFMCHFSKMVVKKNGRMRVYACTLVDDDTEYDLGGTLCEAQKIRVMLKHHRCYSCFACRASCSES